MRKTLVVVAASLVVLHLPTAPAMAEAIHEVVVRNTAFTPDYLEIDPGDTVRWNVEEDGHTITFEDGQLHRTVARGDRVTRAFPDPGTYRYKCSIHREMRGLIQVGPVESPCTDCPSEIRVVPSETFPTLASAVRTAPPRSLIELRPGLYDVTETVEVATPGVMIRGTNDDGTPADPATVVLRGRARVGTGIRVTADSDAFAPAGVENLTLTRFLDSGLAVDGARSFEIKHVQAIDNVEYGIRAVGASDGLVTDSYTAGHRRAGIFVGSCDRCDIRVERSRAENNLVGLEGANAGSLTVRGSRFADNASGIVLRSVATRAPHLQLGSHIFDNDIVDNDNKDAPVPSVFSVSEAMELPVGAGVWIQGGWYDVVEGNRIIENHYGIAVTASTVPSYRVTVRGNFLPPKDGTQTPANNVDLGWDGIGAGVCFEGNHFTASTPAAIDTEYPCGRAIPTGTPHPEVTADLATYAYRTYYCHEIEGGCI